MISSTKNIYSKGEIYELKQDLRSERRDKRKNAIKRIIGYMTVGKDVSELFMDVVNCMQTDNLELKKLIYLYLMSYSKTHPDLAILAVNSFVKDCEDANPLIRALAVRTMGCIRVSNISEYLCEPLRKCLKDSDPYVRKTAVVCVAKLYTLHPQLVEDQGFIQQLLDSLGDQNPMVISNCVACLSEIASKSPPEKKIFEINSDMLNRLLTALNECTEWGQSYILDSIANYDPRSEQEALSICERVTSRLSHSNSALVLSTIKIIMKMMNSINMENPLMLSILNKMAPPLVTMLSYEPEIQYVALRNMDLITQKNPNILKNEINAFFVKYNDPIYIKIEKLAIIIKLVEESNIQIILAELKEYSSEVDVDFVRKSVHAIGRCALKVESSADQCVNTLLDLIQTKVSYVVQESIIVMRDIMRKMPNRYESVIEKLCDNLDSLNEPEARGALIWIIGEYAERIDNASEVLKSFSANFLEESSLVQLSLLTAIVKLFLKKPAENQEFVQDVLTLVTRQCDNPDIRDRGYIYWRLLSTDSVAAKNIILGNKPPISPEADNLDETLLEELLQNLSTLASVYHKSPQTFIEGQYNRRKNFSPPEKIVTFEDPNNDIFKFDMGGVSSNIQGKAQKIDMDINILDLEFTVPTQTNSVPLDTHKSSFSTTVQPLDLLTELFSDLTVTPSTPLANPMTHTNNNQMNALSTGTAFDFLHESVNPLLYSSASPCKLTTWLDSSKGKGLEVEGAFSINEKTPIIIIKITNNALAVMNSFMIQFNLNTFGLIPIKDIELPSILHPKQSYTVQIPMMFGGSKAVTNPINIIQIALKNNVEVFYFSAEFPPYLYFSDISNSQITETQFILEWNHFGSTLQVEHNLMVNLTEDIIKGKLLSLRVFTLAVHSPPILCGHSILMNGSAFLFQFLEQTPQSFKMIIRSNSSDLLSCIGNCFIENLSSA